MKKFLTIALALAMTVALAVPAFAWVGWDAKTPTETTTATLKDFTLAGQRLEFFSSASAGFDWNKTYFATYDPANKGVVEGTHLRGIFTVEIPPKGDITDAIAADLSTLKLTVKPTNFAFDTVDVYVTNTADGQRKDLDGRVAQTVKTNASGNYVFNFSDNKVSPVKGLTSTVEFMFTGYAKTTADAGLSATLSCGQGSFSSGVFTFNVGGVDYKVVHKGNYFYVTNESDDYDRVVRFTVDANDKVTDIAVALEDNYTAKITDVTEISDSQYKKDVAADEDIYMDDLKAIFNYLKGTFEDAIDDNKDSDEVVAALDNAIFKAYTDHNYTYKSYAAAMDAIESNLDDITDNDDTMEEASQSIFSAIANVYSLLYSGNAIGNVEQAIVADGAVDDPESVIDGYTTPREYVRVATPATYTTTTDEDGNATTKVNTWNYSWGILNGTKTVYTEDDFYTASKNAPNATVYFTNNKASIDAGYAKVTAGEAAADFATATGYASTSTLPTTPNEGKEVYVEAADGSNNGTQALTVGSSSYKKALAALNEVLNVLQFTWDGTTKYMYEEKFVELFDGTLSLTADLKWAAYTTTLIVPDVTPPQTGDASSAFGFVMIALAVVAAAAVVVKKVRA